MDVFAGVKYGPGPLRQEPGDRRGDEVDRDFDAAVLSLLGDARLLLRFDKSGTTLTDRSRKGRTLAWSEAVEGFDRAPAELGSGILVSFNGMDERGDISAAADLSFGDGEVDSPLSIAALVSRTAAEGVKTVLSKYDVTTGSSKREWRLYLDASERLAFELYDESAGAKIGRLCSTALAAGPPLLVAATYDGSGASTGIRLYSAGSRLDDADSNNLTYTAMESTACPVRLGSSQGAEADRADFFNGSMALAALTGKTLSPDEVWTLGTLCNGYFGLSL